MAIGLGVAWSREVELDPPFLAEVLEVEANELRAIVCNYLFRDPKGAYDILPYEIFCFVVLDLMESFSLDLFGEVINDCKHVDVFVQGLLEA